ncbi:unnamed protein product, partial [Durusdinium trenchii]
MATPKHWPIRTLEALEKAAEEWNSKDSKEANNHPRRTGDQLDPDPFDESWGENGKQEESWDKD